MRSFPCLPTEVEVTTPAIHCCYLFLVFAAMGWDKKGRPEGRPMVDYQKPERVVYSEIGA
jgi:hypothetical protein